MLKPANILVYTIAHDGGTVRHKESLYGRLRISPYRRNPAVMVTKPYRSA